MADRTVPASNFVTQLETNVDNTKLSDADFREFVRNTLPIVQYETMAEVRARLNARDGIYEFPGS